MSLAIIAPCRSVHMGATQVPKRGEGEEPRFFSPTPLPLSVLMHSKPSVGQNYAYFVHGYSRGTVGKPHASYLVVHMYARADEECSFFFFFPITFSPHILTLSYILLDHVSLLLPLTMLLQNENGRFTAVVYNSTRWRSLCSILRDKSKNTWRLVVKCIFLFTQQ